MSELRPEPSASKKPRSRKLLLIVVAVLVLGGAGGGFFWWKGQQAAAAAEHAREKGGTEDHGGGDGHEAEAEEPGEVAGVLPFEPFIVNLADPGGGRYLKADIRLLVSDTENVKELEEDQAVMMRLRSSILEHLSQQTSEHVVTPAGKEELKKEIASRSSKILKGHAKVADVLFNEFVVQF